MDNKQTNIKNQSWQVTVDSLICHTWAFCLKCVSFSSSLQLLQRPSHQVLTTCFVVSGRKRDCSRHQKHRLFTWWYCTFTSCFYFSLVQFPSPLGCRSQFLGYEHFLLFPLRSTVGTFLHTVIGICQHGNPKSAEAACCSQHLPHLFVLSRYKLGLLHSKTVIKKKLLPVRTGTRKR